QLDAVRGAAREPGEFVGDLHCVVVGGLGESRVAAKARVRDALGGGGHLGVSGGEADVGGGAAGAGREVAPGLVDEVPAEIRRQRCHDAAARLHHGAAGGGEGEGAEPGGLLRRPAAVEAQHAGFAVGGVPVEAHDLDGVVAGGVVRET